MITRAVARDLQHNFEKCTGFFVNHSDSEGNLVNQTDYQRAHKGIEALKSAILQAETDPTVLLVSLLNLFNTLWRSSTSIRLLKCQKFWMEFINRHVTRQTKKA